MPLRARQIVAATAVVGATVLGGTGLVAAQDAGDTHATTEPGRSTTVAAEDGPGDHARPHHGMRGAPGGHAGRHGENCPGKGDRASDDPSGAGSDTVAPTGTSPLAA